MDLNMELHNYLEKQTQHNYFTNGDFSVETILIDDEVESMENSNKQTKEILMNLKEMEQRVETNQRRLQFIFAVNQVIEAKRESMSLITEEDLMSIPNLNLEYVFELYEKQHRNSEYFQRCQQKAKELVAFLDRLSEGKEELDHKDHIIFDDSSKNLHNNSPQSSLSQDEMENDDDNDRSFSRLIRSKQQRKNKLTKKQILLVQLQSQAKKVTQKISKKQPVFSLYKPSKRSMPKLKWEELQKRVSYMQIQISEQKAQSLNQSASLSKYYSHSKINSSQQNLQVKSIPEVIQDCSNTAIEEQTPLYFKLHTSIPKKMSCDSTTTTATTCSQQDIQNQSESPCKDQQYFSFESLSEYPQIQENSIPIEENNIFNISKDTYHGQECGNPGDLTSNLNNTRHEAMSFITGDEDQISGLDYCFQQYINYHNKEEEEHRESLFHNNGGLTF